VLIVYLAGPLVLVRSTYFGTKWQLVTIHSLFSLGEQPTYISNLQLVPNPLYSIQFLDSYQRCRHITLSHCVRPGRQFRKGYLAVVPTKSCSTLGGVGLYSVERGGAFESLAEQVLGYERS
jgi:hypothetical protein